MKVEDESKQQQGRKGHSSNNVQRAQGLAARSLASQGQPQQAASEQLGQELLNIHQSVDKMQPPIHPLQTHESIRRRAGAPKDAQGQEGSQGQQIQSQQPPEDGMGPANGQLGAQGQPGPQGPK
jgi:hypothetical protein